ncbi:MAG: hypothetical protein KA146_00300 [Leptospiraceae bacterium]|nr:hypothetical protein [Leptospiraceae bacterium]
MFDKNKINLSIMEAITSFSNLEGIHSIIFNNFQKKIFTNPKDIELFSEEYSLLFEDFLDDFYVKRNIKKGKITKVVINVFNYISKKGNRLDFNDIDKLCSELQKRNLSSNSSDKNKNIRPLSLASKIAFLSNPELVIPIDKYTKKGIKIILKTRTSKKDYITYYNNAMNIYKNNFKTEVIQNFEQKFFLEDFSDMTDAFELFLSKFKKISNELEISDFKELIAIRALDKYLMIADNSYGDERFEKGIRKRLKRLEIIKERF